MAYIKGDHGPAIAKAPAVASRKAKLIKEIRSNVSGPRPGFSPIYTDGINGSTVGYGPPGPNVSEPDDSWFGQSQQARRPRGFPASTAGPHPIRPPMQSGIGDRFPFPGLPKTPVIGDIFPGQEAFPFPEFSPMPNYTPPRNQGNIQSLIQMILGQLGARGTRPFQY